MKFFSPKSSILALAAVSLMSTVVLVSRDADPASATPGAKVTICHRTRSITNPYRRITVSVNSIQGNSGHQGHDPSNVVWTSSMTTSRLTPWGDIIPATDNAGGSINTNKRKNWTTAGAQDIFNGVTTVGGKAACRYMSAKEFFDSEKAAKVADPLLNIDDASILADLESQGAGEDTALKKALGGSFTGATATTLATATLTQTDPIDGNTITGTSGNWGVTLPGTLKFPVADGTSFLGLSYFFEYSQSSSLASPTSTTTTSLTTNGSNQAASRVIASGLANGIWYYRIVAVQNPGDETEGYSYGDILSFGLGVPRVTTTSLSDGTEGTAYTQTLAATSGSGTYTTWTIPASANNETGLPPGLSLASGSGVISGTPTTKGLYRFRVRVTDSASAVSADQSLTIRIKKAQNITIPDPGSKTFGDSPFNSSTVTDVEPDETSDSGTTTFTGTSGVCTIASNGQVTIVGAGTCTITANHNGNGFFFNGSNSRSFTVAKKNQNVTLNPADKDLDDATVDVSATSDATGSGTVTYSGGTPGVCSVASNGRVTLIGAGTCSVTATHPGNGNFNDGTRTSTFTVRPRPSNNSNNSNSSTSNNSSSSTAATTTTTTAPAVSRGASATGALKGTAWIDMNRNGRREQREPLLANQLIEVSRATATAASARGIVRKQASYTTKTDLNGSYSIPELEPGTWTVKATLTAKELEKTFDSTGAADWSATAVVPTNGVGRADFAAAGTEKLEITVQAQVAPGSTVIVHWAGSDGKFCSGDDIEFEATVVNGKVNLDGVPAGEYKVGEKPVCTFTQTVSPAGVPVIAAKATDTADVATSATVSRATPVTRVTYRPTETLPATGSQPMRIVSWALLALLLGSLFVSAPSFTTVLRRSVSRRRR